jgi:citrate lyase gamma subunit
MTTAGAIVLATGMVCCTALSIVLVVGNQMRRTVREVLDQVKVQGRKVSVTIDKKINVDVDADS